MLKQILKSGSIALLLTLLMVISGNTVHAADNPILTDEDYEQLVAKQESIKKMKISELDSYIDELLDVEDATMNQSQNLMFAIDTRLNKTYGQEMTKSWSKTDTTIKDWLPRIKKSSHFGGLKKDATFLIKDFLKTRKAEHFKDKIGYIALGFIVVILIIIYSAGHGKRKIRDAKRKERGKDIYMI